MIQFPQQPQISIEVAENGYLFRISGNIPTTKVYSTVEEGMIEVQNISDTYRTNLAAWREAQAARNNPAVTKE